MLYKFLIIIYIITSATSSVYAADLRVTDEERKSLPPFCTRGHPEFQTHFCSGLNYINRANRSKNNSAKSFNLNQAVGELSYVINHFKNGWGRMHEAYYNRGLAYSLQGKWKQASEDWNMVIKLNPKITHVYTNLADYYTKYKMNKMALEIVIEGLKHNPETQSLQRKYDQLGGQQPYPAPYISEKPQVAENETQKTEAAKTELAIEKDITNYAPTPITNSQPITQKTPIGSAQNPWCRFCPERPDVPVTTSPSTPVTTPKAEQ